MNFKHNYHAGDLKKSHTSIGRVGLLYSHISLSKNLFRVPRYPLGLLPLSRGTSALQMGSGFGVGRGGEGAGVYLQSVGRSFSLPLGRHATVFQTEVLAILACAHDIKIHGTTEKHESICSDILAALKALEAVRTMSPFVPQCQEALNDISARHAAGRYLVPGHTVVRGNETADGLTRSGSATGFAQPEQALGGSKLDLSNKIGRWLGNQHQRR
jgi:hypothetical protein